MAKKLMMIFAPALLAVLISMSAWSEPVEDNTSGDPASLPAAGAEDVQVKAPAPVSGDSAASKPRARIKWPAFSWNGGEWELNGRWWEVPELPEVKPIKIGIWAAGRADVTFMPLSDRLKPVTEDRGLDPFDDYMLMIGPELCLSVDDSLWISTFFDTGFQTREGRVAGQKRKADVNLSRLGMRFQVVEPMDKLMAGLSLPLFPDPDAGPLRIAALRAGIGLESGIGNLSVIKKGDDLSVDRIANMPFFFLTPMLVGSISWTKYMNADVFAGYSIVTTSSFSREFYFNDKKMFNGSYFDGWVMGLELRFGADSVWSLMPRISRPGH